MVGNEGTALGGVIDPCHTYIDLAKTQNNTHIIGVKYSQMLMICKKNGDLGT